MLFDSVIIVLFKIFIELECIYAKVINNEGSLATIYRNFYSWLDKQLTLQIQVLIY